MGWLLAILFALLALVLVLVNYYLIKSRFEARFRDWQAAESARWQSAVDGARKQAVSQSRAVLGGKFTEQMAPYLPEFKYDPTEARFIGSPVDMIVFPGLSSGEPKEIVIMEIKSNKNCQLTQNEKNIQKLIEDGMVRWELLERRADDGTI